MSSQQQSSPASYLCSQMTRAADLEAKLAALPPKTSEEKASRIRYQLCEVLSDVLLTDPQFSLRKDCFGRLWRNCFYARIGELRSRIAREKRKQGPQLPQLEQTLKTFLKEAVVLYKYLVDKYEAKLLPLSQMSQDDLSDASTADTAGVVPGLHRILIHLGDLHRYSNSYSQAENSYDKASKLAPGKGNPYNQLAVVAQLKDPSAPLSCVALYYYARALMATHDPFETSKANLSRLFESNREWFQTTSEQAMLAASTNNKAGGTDKARTLKTIQSRLFLGSFVDLHYDFFTENRVREEYILGKIEITLTKLDHLLKEWAFGDSLLSKMVAINAFSVQWTKGNAKVLARAFTLRFGAALAERLERGLRKAMEKNTPSVRLLLPLLLLCEYGTTWTDFFEMAVLEKSVNEYCMESNQVYLNQIARVASQLSPLSDSMSMHKSSGARLKEYDNLCGFAPFDPFVNQHSQDIYVSVDEAIRVLELALSGSTQESTTFTQSSASGPEENAMKLKRFFEIMDTMVEKEHLIRTADGQYRVRSAEVEDVPVVQYDDDMEDNMIVDFDNVEPPIVAEPVKHPHSSETVEMGVERSPLPRAPETDKPMLVYKQSEGGAGPALLVPGALLLNKSQEAAPSNEKLDKISSSNVSTEEFPKESRQDPLEKLLFAGAAAATPLADVSMEERQAPAPAPLGPPPGILPPPGFGAPTAALAPGFRAPQPPPMQTYLQAMYSTSFAQPATLQGSSDGDTVLNMLRGTDVSTANPFMIPPAPAPDLFPPPSSSGLFMDPDDMDDGTSYLDSSLLSSMLMDEGNSQPRSKNPFLT